MFDEASRRRDRPLAAGEQSKGGTKEGPEGSRAGFNGSSNTCEATFLVSVSFCEIYNEGVYDLLESGSNRNGPIETWPKVRLTPTLNLEGRG